jgi:hypothetical protein
LGLSSPAVVHAGTAIVTNCATSALTVGSLPWAAAQAVNNGDIIDLTGISDFSACQTSVDGFAHSILLSSAVTVATGVTIKGPNTPSSKALAVSTYKADRVFYSTGNITINNLGIKYGTAKTTNGSIGGTTVYGGCVFARNGIELNGVVLDHCTASATAAGNNAKGGAVATFFTAGTITLTNSTVSHATATSSSGDALGGALYATSNITLNSSSVYGNAMASAGNAAGGGIAIAGGAYTVALSGSDVDFSYANAYGTNHTALGGGIFSSGNVTLDANSGLFATIAYQHTATGGRAAGGGIFAESGVSLSGGSSLAVCYARTLSNANAKGGGIYSATDVSLSNASIGPAGVLSTSGKAYGGGIFAGSGTTSHYSSISSAYAVSGSSSSQGGAIYSKGGVEFKYGTIGRSHALQAGGIAVPTGDLYLRGATLYNNYAKSNASAVGMFTGGTSSTATIVNSTISGNTVGSSGKYAVFISAHSTNFYNSTIAYNTGGTAAGTVLTGASGSTAGLYSTLMSSNSYSNGTQNDFSKNVNVTFTANSSNNLIRHPGSIVPTGTLSGASACPLLHKLATGKGEITATHRPGGALRGATRNPAIDAGSNAKSLGSDQRGGALSMTTPARVSGIATDIGAYEVQQNDILFDSEFETCPN